MKLLLSTEDQERQEKFAELASTVRQDQSEKLHERVTENPYPTIEENALGAFLEMYEPHLIPIVIALLGKGHIVEPTSGFGKEHPECQILYGQFFLDDKIINALAKINVIIHKETKTKYFKFYPAEASLDTIVQTYEQIVSLFPSLKRDIEISQTPRAKQFRRTYTPQDSTLKQTRLFEILMYEINERVSHDIQKRLSKNPYPTTEEMHLGVFIEMIEPQVRDAVRELNKKGYSTDASGFMGRSDMQGIEGDFTIDETLSKQLEAEGVTVVTTHSGYTCIQFQPREAKFDEMYEKWMSIASMLPNRKEPALPSMTVKAREFRKKYTPSISL